jgi:23S rRNA pseudouridine2605 synthase
LAEVDAHWSAGRVRVLTDGDDAPRLLPLETLVFDSDQVLVDGIVIGSAAPARHVLLNKPKFVTSTARDPRGKSDLSPYLRAMPRGCFPVGRLDRETTGLLLFTNDGDLASAILRPDHSTHKNYWLWIDEPLADDDARLAQLQSGVTHCGELLSAAAFRIRSRTEYATELELTLTQGKKRQIRLMCRALNLQLVHLHRYRIGSLSDAGLALGEFRELAAAEVEALWEAAGGRAAHRKRQLVALGRQAVAARLQGTPLERLEDWLRQEPTA